jgi:hypothetical protein
MPNASIRRKTPIHAPASVPKLSRKTNPPRGNGNTGRARNGQRRTTGNPLFYASERKHLPALEIQRLIEATQHSRNETRDRCLFLLIFRHGLQVSGACRLKLNRGRVALGPDEGGWRVRHREDLRGVSRQRVRGAARLSSVEAVIGARVDRCSWLTARVSPVEMYAIH